MLSYRHGFHAGNFADVLKHIVLDQALTHLCRKPGGFDYIDTHAGAGRYDLRHERASRLREHAQGIWRLGQGEGHRPDDAARRQWWPELSSWFAIVDVCNRDGGEAAGAAWHRYPGSPAIALHHLRAQDRAWLFELHPREHEALLAFVGRRARVKVMNDDGFRGLSGLLPPASRRAVVMIDPAYEVKADYETVFSTVAAATRRFATGLYLVWYPVVNRNRVQRLERQFGASGIRNILQVELCVRDDSPGHGMTGCGLFVINPPFTLRERMTALLPRLKTALTQDGPGHWRCVQLVDE